MFALAKVMGLLTSYYKILNSVSVRQSMFSGMRPLDSSVPQRAPCCGDVQSGLVMTNGSTMVSGIGVGWLLACRNKERKVDNLSLDKASARVLWIPGIYSAITETCHLAWIKARYLIRCITSLL